MQLKIQNKGFFNGTPDWGESKNWFYENFQVHYRVAGEESKPPIVLIHGFGASSDHWRNNAEIFASEGFRVFGIDLIGFGKSEQNLQSKIKYLENQFWANQLSSFLDEIVDIEKNGNDGGYEGAIVLPPKCDLYLDEPVACVDYSSLYPSCLLYTSPSPRDGLLSRMPSSA